MTKWLLLEHGCSRGRDAATRNPVAECALDIKEFRCLVMNQQVDSLQLDCSALVVPSGQLRNVTAQSI